MKMILRTGIYVFCMAISASCFANYQGFNSSSICNGYPKVIGVVDLLTATQTYETTYGMYVRVKGNDGRNYGGVFYYRKNTDAAYKQMTTLALTSLITKSKVRICYNGDDVYALELRGDSV